ncbi:hypothetical protein K875_02688 [Mycobacterium [tuberculosis] TKK-01-0051]|uniref:Uncharacterized protein n=1 Tax=Mycobacterium [tuberculosis] TKK-01-0051 TaxID=1324261 RepID=A0A051U1T2_9MYCO|nr:hypothetical protein K875_02688 [Mycobacterium [tuberculosis] TKK-01-0051]
MGTTTADSLGDALGAPTAANQFLNHVTPDR